ncbi:MAG: TauD/TfdA family dioxygenase [Dongiaceae bacterium]
MSNQGTDLTISPLTPRIGAVVGGIDLAEPASNDAHGRLQDALLRHKVLFFERQEIAAAAAALTFGRHVLFGPLHIHPLYPQVPGQPEILVLDNHAGNPTDNDTWHTDVTFIETPPLGSVLHARTLPPQGGDTPWSDMEAAHQALSELIDSCSTGSAPCTTSERPSGRPCGAAAPSARRAGAGAWTRHPPVVLPGRPHPPGERRQACSTRASPPTSSV